MYQEAENSTGLKSRIKNICKKIFCFKCCKTQKIRKIENSSDFDSDKLSLLTSSKNEKNLEKNKIEIYSNYSKKLYLDRKENLNSSKFFESGGIFENSQIEKKKFKEVFDNNTLQNSEIFL